METKWLSLGVILSETQEKENNDTGTVSVIHRPKTENTGLLSNGQVIKTSDIPYHWFVNSSETLKSPERTSSPSKPHRTTCPNNLRGINYGELPVIVCGLNVYLFYFKSGHLFVNGFQVSPHPVFSLLTPLPSPATSPRPPVPTRTWDIPAPFL